MFVSALLILVIYFLINFISELIESYLAVDGDGDIERLDLVQANRQQELFHSKIYRKINSISSEYFEIPQINDNVEQVFNFADNKGDGLNRQVMLNSYIVIAKIVSVISIAITLYMLNKWLCLIVLIAPLPTLWLYVFGEKLQFRFIKDNTKLSRRANYFQELMLSKSSKEIKTLGIYEFFHGKWKHIVDEYTLRERKMYRNQMIIGIINSLILNLINIGCLVFAIILMTQGLLSLGELAIAFSLVGILVNDSNLLLVAIGALFMKKNYASQFFDLMDKEELEDEGVGIDKINSINAIDLRYRYPLTQKYVLDGVNINIKKGEKIALIGENGSGKSTFIKQITGLLQPTSGTLEVNDIEIEKINPFVYFNNISTVLQNPSRYETFSVGDNVYIGETNCERNEKLIDSALEFSDFSKDKKKLLGKDIGGTDLSGAEWQKLAIARSVYRNKNFIILDEPTSNLGPLIESLVFEKYLEHSKNKTVIFVTHRISIASLADRIIVLKKGKVVQDGTHEELMTKNSEYANLYNEQAKWYER